MDERRKSLRTDLKVTMSLKKVVDGNESVVPATVVDLSRTGIGFTCDEKLDIGTIYEADLTIWTKEVIHVYFQMVRIEITEKGYSYGGFFIGMTDMDLNRISTYQTIEQMKEKD